jgi:hypothetical protein
MTLKRAVILSPAMRGVQEIREVDQGKVFGKTAEFHTSNCLSQ